MPAQPEPAAVPPDGLLASDRALCDVYDVAMLDLDGVVYRADEPVADAERHLAAARRRGMTLAFVTNNASRTPEAVAARLQTMGVEADAASVVTAAQAVARLIAERIGAGGRVLAVGGEGLDFALREQDLLLVRSADDAPDAVAQGLSPDLSWRALLEASVAVARGVPWYAANTDRTIPTARGIAPGNGTFVDAVRAAAGGEPVVAGKPAPALFSETALRVGARRPLVVGDRLDTDIAGARAVGADSLLVLTGVTDLASAAAASPVLRPSYVGWDLASLCAHHDLPTLRPGSAELRDWRAEVEAGGQLSLSGCGDWGDALRVVVALCWRHLDETGEDVDVRPVVRRFGTDERRG